MSRIQKLLIGALATIAVGSTVVVQAAVPFKGSGSAAVTGQEVVTQNDVVITAIGIGESTELGRYTRVETLHLDPATGILTGSIAFIAANGDHLTADVSGQFVSLTAAAGTYTLTGGTGRFASAGGAASFSVSLTSPGTFTFEFEGAIAW